jgi:ATPase family associated with various cellular activities (AAA)
MLYQAIIAGIPIITCRTTDVINLGQVLAYVSDGACRPWITVNQLKSESVYYMVGVQEGMDFTKLYGQLVSEQSVLIIANPDTPILEAFDVGEVPVPRELVAHYLSKIVGNDTEKYLRVLSGLTIKQVVEVIRLSQAENGHLDPQHMSKMRALLAGKMQGLAPVNTDLDVYVPNIQLIEWLKENKKFFLKPVDPSLVPRGLILNGPPGVGKTQAAKYIANEFGVPLYRLDMATGLGRYVGESESNLSRALTTIDQEAPCVFLIDEVEKLFAEKEDSGVTSRLLAQLLWWLQEHDTQVFTVMTTNDLGKLPKELWRPGRIDKLLSIPVCGEGEARNLLYHVIGKYFTKMSTEQMNLWINQTKEPLSGRSHAEIVEVGKKIAKDHWKLKQGFDKQTA